MNSSRKCSHPTSVRVSLYNVHAGVFVVVFVRGTCRPRLRLELQHARPSPAGDRKRQSVQASVAKRLPALEPGGQSTAEAIDRLLQASAEQAITKWHSL